MSPDTPETRIARLEQKVAKLEQRVEDLLVTIQAQFAALESDVRAFAPLATEVNDLQNKLALALSEARGARVELKELRESLEARAERDRVERKSSQRYIITAVLTSAGLVIAAIQVLGGLG